jgi:hypothetical protein
VERFVITADHGFLFANQLDPGMFMDGPGSMLKQVEARLDLVDVRAFGLTWEDCEQTLRALGYTVRVELVPA